MSLGSRLRLLQPAVAQGVVDSVLESLSSPRTQAAYRIAILDFLAWWTGSPQPLGPATFKAWRSALVGRKLAPSSINQRLSAVRLFLRHAKEQGLLASGDAADLLAIEGVELGVGRRGQWLTATQAGQLLGVPDSQTRIGKRDRAMLALLVACGLRREELVHLECKHVKARGSGWVLALLPGVGPDRRTIPLPLWVKHLLDEWLEEAGIHRGVLFRRLRKNGKLDRDPRALSNDTVYVLVKSAGAAIGKPELTVQDLRRTCAQLCREAGGALEQIQLLLGHASVATTERYLGPKQEGEGAVNDRLKIPIKRDRR